MPENTKHGGSRLNDRAEISNRQENNENDYSQSSNYYNDEFDINNNRNQQSRNRSSMNDTYGQNSRMGWQGRNEWEEQNRTHQNRGGWGAENDRQQYSSESDNWNDRRQGTNYGMGRPYQSRNDYQQEGDYNSNYSRQGHGREDYGSHNGNYQGRNTQERWNEGSRYNSNRDTQYGSGSFGQGSSPYSSNFGQRSQMGRDYDSQMDRNYNSQMDRNYSSQTGPERGAGYNNGGQFNNWGEQGQHKGKGPKGYQRSDERIKEDVNDRLTDDSHIDASQIEVNVTNGEVKLTGTVDDRSAKRHAEDIAESVSGVLNVENSIRIQSQDSRTDGSNASSGTATAGSSASKSAGSNMTSNSSHDTNGDKSKRAAHQHN